MKKLLAILVLSLLWCNTSFADPIMLSCEPQDKKNKPLSFIIDDKNKNQNRTQISSTPKESSNNLVKNTNPGREQEKQEQKKEE